MKLNEKQQGVFDKLTAKVAGGGVLTTAEQKAMDGLNAILDQVDLADDLFDNDNQPTIRRVATHTVAIPKNQVGIRRDKNNTPFAVVALTEGLTNITLGQKDTNPIPSEWDHLLLGADDEGIIRFPSSFVNRTGAKIVTMKGVFCGFSTATRQEIEEAKANAWVKAGFKPINL